MRPLHTEELDYLTWTAKSDDEYAEVARLETEMAEDRPAIPSGVGIRLCKRAGINLDS